MWWLCNDAVSKPEPFSNAAPPMPPPKSQRKPPQKSAATVKRDPLIDTLTPQQNQANRVLGQVQCGHQADIKRLTGDIVSLEGSLRQYVAQLDSNRTHLEASERMLQAAQEKVKLLEAAAMEKDSELEQLRTQLDQQQSSNAEMRQRLTHRTEMEVAQRIKTQHQVAELTTALEQQDAQHRDQMRHNHEAVTQQRNQDQAALDQAQQISELWQTDAFRFQGEAERFHNGLVDCEQELQVSARCIVGLESEAAWKDRQIETLSQRQQELQHAESTASQRAEYWQAETRRNQTLRREMSEQNSRQMSVAESTIQDLTNALDQARQRDSMQQLRMDRLRSIQQQQEHKAQQEKRASRVSKLNRQRELSEVQVQLQQQTSTMVQMKQRSRWQESQVILLNDAVTAAKAQQASAWAVADEAVSRLQLQERSLHQVTETRERLVQMQSHQYEAMQTRIDCLIGQVDNARMAFDMEIVSLQQLVSERDGLVDQLVDQQNELARTNDLMKTTHQQLLHESAKARAQLSGGRAKGIVLIDEYERRLKRAMSTIDALRQRIAPSSNSRAA